MSGTGEQKSMMADPLGFADAACVRKALDRIEVTAGAADAGNLQGLSAALFLAALSHRVPGPVLVLLRDDNTLDRMDDELGFLRGLGLLPADTAVACLPDYEVTELDAPLAVEDRRRRRLDALYQLYCTDTPGLILATPGGARRFTPGKSLWLEHTGRLKPGDSATPEDLLDFLTASGYERHRDVDRTGRVCLRGGLLDVWPAHAHEPLRIEFYGNSVDEIRRFDPRTQRSQEKIDLAELPPASEVIFSQAELESDLLRKDHRELIRRGIYFDAGVLYPSLFGSAANPLLDGQFCTMVCMDPDRCGEAWGNASEAAAAWLQRKDFPDPQGLFSNIYADWPEDLSPLAKCVNLHTFTAGADADLPVKMLPPLPLDLNEITRILRREAGGGRVVIISRYKKRLQSYLEDQGVDNIQIFEGAVRGGFRLDEAGLSVFTDSEMFQRGARKPKVVVRKQKDRRPITAPADIEKGDYVVHVDHGVGRYKGITTQTSPDGVQRDFFSIDYARGDTLFVPIEQIDRIEKYIGAKAAPPKVYPLHSGRWGRVKTKARKKIEDMASTLYALYSEREQARGLSFSPDNLFMQELEEAFPFEETEDQLVAIQNVKEDMERDRPMDRLVYGDVGYGKTEVAVRAAFKAAMDKKQVAILAPTTILTQQHGRTFRRRLARFPVTVDVLNRFRTAKEKRDILKRLADGSLDIVIGTHALLAESVRFKDLGLLVVDEEQRFGVKHKERLKMLRINVDVLTLTATPIPRTLHMSMINLRDMSLIETPPEDRKAVKTFVEEWNMNSLYAGISRELARDGQVFFVHNDIFGIGEVEAFLSNTFPEARIAVCHGQMPASRIERTMDEFMEQQHDILLSTTIIENGLDIPNVNTLVVNGAENFGLGQLYQLRGRVGRSFRQSYAYFFYSPFKLLNDNARKRLEALRDFADLGSGYRLAMKDLEIRGAGNLLGREQHGFIAEIGFNLYCRMLAESVDKVRGTPAHIPPPVEVDLAVSAYLPEDYMPDTRTRTEFYKKIVAADGILRVDRITEEIKDRFGPLPGRAAAFVDLARVRIHAAALGVSQIKTHPHNELTDMLFHNPETLEMLKKTPDPSGFDLETVFLKDRLRFIHEGVRPRTLIRAMILFLDNAVQHAASLRGDDDA